ncbi:pilus assembly PilX family protein [Pseudoduganella sp. R-32]|uniref:pilus assembly PilX family protein n=1 Tax=unclassified Pseudoduganella TaxID=2637179 RepID=UPI003CF6998F
MKSVVISAWRRQQEGVALIMALIVLVAMTLAGLAMMRSVDGSSLVAGNLAFKQSASISADAGVEAAIAWLHGNPKLLNEDHDSEGYSASSQDDLDLTGNNTVDADDDLDWSKATLVKKLPVDSAGNQVSYVIHRMCQTAGVLDPAICASTPRDTAGGPTDDSVGILLPMLTYQTSPGNSSNGRSSPFGLYRITVRVAGPRSNVSFVQAIISQ